MKLAIITTLIIGFSCAQNVQVLIITLDEQGKCTLQGPDIKFDGKINIIAPGWMQTINVSYFQDMAYKISSQGQLAVLVDWSQTSNNWFYPAIDIRPASACLAEFIEAHLCSDGSPNVNLIGFSLGAHVVGLAGRFLQTKNCTIPRIIALEATGLDYLGPKIHNSLRPTDATSVVQLHTNDNFHGNIRHLGTVNFYANLGLYQPICPISPASNIMQVIFCNAVRALLIYIEAIGSRGFVGKRCSSMFFCDNKDTLVFNDEVPLNASGNYYFFTKWFAPFALG